MAAGAVTETRRSTPAFAIGAVEPLFACKICGAETPLRQLCDVRSVCPEHCDDHDYEYDRFDRRHYCAHCGAEPPDDWYYCDDDVGFGGGYSSDQPIGIRASAMNGNAAARHEDPAAWANWVAFCERNGHP